MYFPVYEITPVDFENIVKPRILIDGVTCIKGIVLVSDIGVTYLKNKENILQIKILPTNKDHLILFKKGEEKSFFFQFQVELFWVCGIKEADITKDEDGYYVIEVPPARYLIGHV